MKQTKNTPEVLFWILKLYVPADVLQKEGVCLSASTFVS